MKDCISFFSIVLASLFCLLLTGNRSPQAAGKNTGSQINNDSTGFRIDEKFDIDKSRIRDSVHLMVSPGSFEMSYEIIEEGIVYNVCLGEKGRLTFASIRDSAFITDGNIRVGTTFKEIKDRFGDSIRKEPGWAYYQKLPSGWAAAFCTGSSCTGSLPAGKDKVSFFFKRK